MPPQENEGSSTATGTSPDNGPPESPPASPNWSALRVSIIIKYSFPNVVSYARSFKIARVKSRFSLIDKNCCLIIFDNT